MWIKIYCFAFWPLLLIYGNFFFRLQQTKFAQWHHFTTTTRILQDLPNLNIKVKIQRILVLVVERHHRANGLLREDSLWMKGNLSHKQPNKCQRLLYIPVEFLLKCNINRDIIPWKGLGHSNKAHLWRWQVLDGFIAVCDGCQTFQLCAYYIWQSCGRIRFKSSKKGTSSNKPKVLYNCNLKPHCWLFSW